MLGLKNFFLSALMVIGATAATAGLVGLVVMMFAMSRAEGEQATGTFFQAGPAVIVMAGFAGAFFSIVSLGVALVTMPPVIGVMKLCKAPRPLFDILGGAVAGFLCAQVMVSILDSFARAKGGDWGGNEMGLILEFCAMFGGGVLGYLRHVVLVKTYEEPAVAQFA